MMLGIESHPVISLAAPNRKAPHNFIGYRIDDCKNVLILQIHVHLTRYGIVLRHPGLAVKMQGLNDFVLDRKSVV